jgi:hypothetical protein
MDPFRAAEPIHLDPQLGQRLLHYPLLPGRPRYQNSAIGDTPTQRLKLRFLAGLKPICISQIGQQLIRLFDVEIFHALVAQK